MTVLDLAGEWKVRKNGRGKGIKAIVPGDVYADLLRAGEIPDPFYRDNEERLQWIGECGWSYARDFHVADDLLSQDRICLSCEGLDTFATITLNGQPVAETDNMFRIWEWEVKRLLKRGKNTLRVDFASTLPYIRRRQEKAGRPVAGDKERAADHGWVRKEPCNYGWDWGIKAVTCGIWRRIRLTAFSAPRITDVNIMQDHSKSGRVGLNVTAATDCIPSERLTVRVTAADGNEIAAEAEGVMTGDRLSLDLTVTSPRLWWPNGMGDQPLYDVTVEFIAADGTVLDTSSRRVGLRSLRLDRHPDRWGESFQFVVNGVPFFAKGANWIPADGVLARVTPEHYQRLLRDAAEAHMNMLRVWGGGIYEADVFYDTCDRLGICVWQDFMFACAAYPVGEKSFRDSVEAEACDQVRRLRHHPSLALWCGNNELEQGHVPKRMSWKQYGRVFDRLLADIVARYGPGTDYWPSSPHTPHGKRHRHNDPTCGDAHLWEVWHGREPFEWYRSCEHRFNSEFGFQSFTAPKTTATFTAPEDRNITSRIMEHHQRSGVGNTLIMQYMLEWFRLPLGFDNTLWVSQILQGMAMKYACEHWRRSMPRGMGTLYWQFNDTWPVASWSSVDYFGRWKALQYMARHFFAPLLISGVEDAEAGTVEVHVTSDLPRAAAGTVRWSVTDLDGVEQTSGHKKVRITPRSNRHVTTVALKTHLARCHSHGLLVWLYLEAPGQPMARNLVLFARPKHLELARSPRLTVKASHRHGGGYQLSLSAGKPALWVWLDMEGEDARFSDNFFHLRPGEPVHVELTETRVRTTAEIKKKLTVRSLVDTY